MISSSFGLKTLYVGNACINHFFLQSGPQSWCHLPWEHPHLIDSVVLLTVLVVRSASTEEVGAALEQWWLSTSALLLVVGQFIGKRRDVEGKVRAAHILEALLSKTVGPELLQENVRRAMREPVPQEPWQKMWQGC